MTYDLATLSKADRSRLLSRADVDLSGAMSVAQTVIDRVRDGGDQALLICAEEYDSFVGEELRVPLAEIKAARARVSKELMRAMVVCKERIERFHSFQLLESFEFRDEAGVFGQNVVPLERVGIYVPGGTASYASSVLMASVPARAAGVKDIVMCTPAKNGKVGDAVLAAADLCGIDEVYSVGGAQSIAAMAYGTETIRPVKKIVGPGGAFVAAAKLLVRNDCEIDFLAGPSEVLIVADDRADPRILAAEMLAQLEHDPLARALLVTPSKRVIGATMDELRKLTSSAPRRGIIEQASKDGAVFILADGIPEAVGFANEYAPEHLVLDVSSPKTVLGSVKNAGSVFLGRYSSVSFGDYCAGPNHILPTKGVASMRSSLSTYDFLKIIPYQAVTRGGAAKLVRTTEVMSCAEGLPGHAQAAAMRKKVRG